MIYVYLIGAPIFAGLCGYADDSFDYKDGRDVFTVGLLAIFWPIIIVILILAGIAHAAYKIKRERS